MASPSRTSSVAGSDRATATTSGSRSVMSSRLRVAICTSSPRRWTWIRMPSSFTSTATGRPGPPPALAIAAATSAALEASIGSTGRPTSRPTPASASSPPVMAATTIGTVPPASIAARRTAVSFTPEAAATASCTRASSAPWRTPAGDEPAQPALLVGGRPREEGAHAGRPRLLRAGPGQGGERVERLVDLEGGQGRLVGRLRKVADTPPADAGAALQDGAADVRRHDRELGRLGLHQPLGDRRDLGLARPGGGDDARGVDEVAQQHGAIVAEPADTTMREDYSPMRERTS